MVKCLREILQGVWLVMIQVECRGRVDGLTVGISSRSSSGSATGREWVGCLVTAGGLLGFLSVLRCRSWMWLWGTPLVMAGMIDGMAYTLSGGVVGLLLGWRVNGGFVGWFASWRVSWRTCGFSDRSLIGRLGGGTRGLQLLATTVSSSLSSSVRRWNGLLLQVWRWWTNGICRMTLCAVVLFDVVATLRGGASATLRLGATTLVSDKSTVAVEVVDCCPIMIAMSCCMARTCLSFTAVDDGTLAPSALRRLAAAAMER